MSNIQSIVENFANQLTAVIEEQVLSRARATVAAALGGAPPKRGPGRPPKVAKALAAVAAAAPGRPKKKARKKAPPQYCPVPGCKNKAAPIFGMVCADHKNVPKAKIKEYREARRAQKAGKAAQGNRKTKKPGRRK
jgi:hypothetical protein